VHLFPPPADTLEPLTQRHETATINPTSSDRSLILIRIMMLLFMFFKGRACYRLPAALPTFIAFSFRPVLTLAFLEPSQMATLILTPIVDTVASILAPVRAGGVGCRAEGSKHAQAK
jgi:hypothetical protein